MPARRTIPLLLALATGARLPAQLHGPENQLLKRLQVREFGAIPDSGDDSGPAIRATIAAALEAGGPAEVVLDRGVYRLGAEPGGEYALTIARARALVLRGQGSATELVVTNPEVGGIRLSDCKAVAVTGLSIDYDPIRYVQRTATDTDPAGNAFALSVNGG